MSIEIKEGTEGQESQVDDDQYGTEAHHVPLGFLEVTTCQILLHHVLIESCHHNGDEGSAQTLQKEVLRSGFPEEDLTVGALLDGFDHTCPLAAHVAGNPGNSQSDRGQHEEGLQRICEHHGSDASPVGVKIDGCNRQCDRQRKRGGPSGFFKDELKDDGHEIETK